MEFELQIRSNLLDLEAEDDLDRDPDRPRISPGKVTRVMRRYAGGSLAAPAAAEIAVAHAETASGKPLPSALRHDLEAALGRSLDGVTIHDDGTAHAAADALGAEAFAIGQHLFFADGAYDPDGAHGRELIAHEVAHTVQAASASSSAARRHGQLALTEPGDAHERAADDFAEAFAGSRPTAQAATAVVGGGPHPGVAMNRRSTAARAPVPGFVPAEPPREGVLLSLPLATASLPAEVARALGGNPRVSCVVARTGTGIVVYVGTRTIGLAREVDLDVLVDAFARLAGGMTAEIRHRLAALQPERITAVGGSRAKFLLSPPTEPEPDFVVIDLAAAVVGLSRDSMAGFRPVEARINAGPAGSAAVFRGDELGASQALAGRGRKLGPPFHLVDAKLGKLAGGDGKSGAWVSVFHGPGTLSIAIATTREATRGVVATIGIEYLIRRVLSALGKAAALAGRGLAALMRAARALGDRLLALAGRVLELRLSGDGSSFFRFDLAALLPRLALSGFSLRDLLPTGFRLGGHGGGLFSLPELPDLGELLGHFAFPTARLARLAGYLRRLIPGVHLPDLSGVALDVRVWLAGPTDLLSLSIDLSGLLPSFGGGKGHEIGFSIPLGALFRKLAAGAGALADAVKALLARGWHALKERVSVDRKGTLRVLLDAKPRASGNRVGFDLTRFFDGFQHSDLVPTELHLESGGAELSYGSRSKGPDEGPGPAVLVARPDAPVQAQLEVDAPSTVARYFGKKQTKLLVVLYDDPDHLLLYAAVHPGDRGLRARYPLAPLRSRLATRLFGLAGAGADMINLQLTARGLWIGAGSPNAPEGSYALYSLRTLAELVAGGVDIAALVPDRFRIQRAGLGFDMTGKRTRRAKLPATGKRRKVGDLPKSLATLLHRVGLTDAHILHVDLDASTVTATDDGAPKAHLIGGAYLPADHDDGGFEGTVLELDVDLAMLLRAFFPDRLVQRMLSRSKQKHRPAGATFEDGRVEVWAQTTSKKGKTFRIEAGWSIARLVTMLMALDDVLDHPSLLVPDQLTGTFASRDWRLTFRGSKSKADRSGSAIQVAKTPLASLLDPRIAKHATLYLNLDVDELGRRLGSAIAHNSYVDLASVRMVIDSASGGKPVSYAVTLGVSPKAAIDLIALLPGGQPIRVGKAILDIVQDPGSTADEVIYTSDALVDLMKDTILDPQSALFDPRGMTLGDLAGLVYIGFSADTRRCLQMYRAAKRLRRAGVISGGIPRVADKVHDYFAADPESVRQMIQWVAEHSDKELRKLGKMRKQANNDEALRAFAGWYSQLPGELKQELGRLDALAEHLGIQFSAAGLQRGFNPGDAATRLRNLRQAIARIEAGAEAAQVLRELGGAGVGDTEAHAKARDTYQSRMRDETARDGDSHPGAAPDHAQAERGDGAGAGVDVSQLSTSDLRALVRDGSVVVRHPGARPKLVRVDANDRARAGKLLASRLGVIGSGPESPEEALELARYAAELAKAEARAGAMGLDYPALARAIQENPRWVRKHGQGPDAFGAGNLSADSVDYAIFIANWQHAYGMRVDGIAGMATVKKLLEVRGDAPAMGGADKMKPRHAPKISVSPDQMRSLVYWDEKAEQPQLALVAGAEQPSYWKDRAHPADGLMPEILDVRLEQKRTSEPGERPIYRYWLVFRVAYIAADENHQSRPIPEEVRVGPYVFSPDALGPGRAYVGPLETRRIPWNTVIDFERGELKRDELRYHGITLGLNRLRITASGEKQGRTWWNFTISVAILRGTRMATIHDYETDSDVGLVAGGKALSVTVHYRE